MTRSGDAANPTGLTFHVLGAGYDPPQRHVGAGQGAWIGPPCSPVKAHGQELPRQ